jgi:hypothetical protein
LLPATPSPELATLVLAIATTNLFNRVSVATRQVTGAPPRPPDA